MKQIILFIATLCTLSITSLAQNEKVVLCEDYNKIDGTPTGIYKSWDVNKNTGSNVYIIYSQDKNIKDKLMLYVDKKNNTGSYIAYDTQGFTYNPSSDKKNWAMYDYKFTESGDYRISVMGKSDDALAVTYTNIGYMKESSNSSTSSNSTKSDDGGITDTYYYENTKVEFGTGADDKGNLIGKSGKFSLSEANKGISCKISDDKALKVKKIFVDIYSGKDYSEKISSDSYTIESLDWDWLKVNITVNKIGKYAVDIYNENDTFMNSGYFEIGR